MKLPALREIVEERKGKAIESLSDSFAKNKLPLEEYERLVDYINKIESERELIVVEKMVTEFSGGGFPDDAADEDESDYYPQHGYNASSNLTILSNRIFTGPFKSGSQFVSILGSGLIKVRKSDLSARKTTLNVLSILGEIVVSVESGIKVSNKAIPIFGGSWTDNKVNQQSSFGEPELQISGTVLLGNVTVKLLLER